MSLSGITKKTKKKLDESKDLASLGDLSSIVEPEQLIKDPSIAYVWKNQNDNLSNKLSFAIRYGKPEFFRKILKENPNFLKKDLLYEAALAGREEHVRMLVEEFDIDVNAQAKEAYNSYPLMGAVCNGHSSIVEYLLSKGARVDVERNFFVFKETPIQCCQRELKWNKDGKLNVKYIEIFNMLVRKGANLEQPHQHLKESPREYIEALKNNPEYYQELTRILSNPEPSMSNITEIMDNLKLNFGNNNDDISTLLFAINSLSLSKESSTSRSALNL